MDQKSPHQLYAGYPKKHSYQVGSNSSVRKEEFWIIVNDDDKCQVIAITHMALQASWANKNNKFSWKLLEAFRSHFASIGNPPFFYEQSPKNKKEKSEIQNNWRINSITVMGATTTEL